VVIIWYIFAVLVCCTKKNLATLLRSLCTGQGEDSDDDEGGDDDNVVHHMAPKHPPADEGVLHFP
jgi:hypothetical protein